MTEKKGQVPRIVPKANKCLKWFIFPPHNVRWGKKVILKASKLQQMHADLL